MNQVTEIEETAAVAAFHVEMHASNMYGLWELTSQMTPQPTPKAVPYIWRWSVVGPLVERAGRVVPIGDERRALQLFNPGLEGRWATTNTINSAVQLLLPGETARAHRHTPTAIRFGVSGSGSYTAVDGERVFMEPGDLVLTPAGTWHDHGNVGDEPVVWLDGLDIPLVQSLDAIFFEFYEERQVPLRHEANASEHLYGHGHLNPTWIEGTPAASPLLLYSWRQVRSALDALRDAEASAYDGVLLEYTNPRTAGAILPTLACYVQLIRPRTALKAHRHTGSGVYHVVQGEGRSVIDGQEFAWTKGDIFCIPSWALHEHANTSDEAAILSRSRTHP